jgi:hypothetical protein
MPYVISGNEAQKIIILNIGGAIKRKFGDP